MIILMISRELKPLLKQKMIPGQVVVLYGPRRVGKTTLLEEVAKEFDGRVKFLNAERSIDRAAIDTLDFTKIQSLVSGTDLLIIDEAQKIASIGQTLKLVVDHFPEKCVLISGSASLDLAYKVGEPLTGRKRTLTLYPLSIREISTGSEETFERLDELIIYGGYPKVVGLAAAVDKQEELDELTSSYLFKDILDLEDVRHADKITDLLRLLAFQVGSEVSLRELASNIQLSVNTVARYLDLLQKTFVIYSLSGFSRNLRKEITKQKKYYFFDLGVRNALIRNFNTLDYRQDVGALWENFCLNERLKYNTIKRRLVNSYFWRTYDQQEIDYLEDSGGQLTATEFKYRANQRAKPPKTFLETYPNASYQLITKETLQDWLKA